MLGALTTDAVKTVDMSSRSLLLVGSLPCCHALLMWASTPSNIDAGVVRYVI